MTNLSFPQIRNEIRQLIRSETEKSNVEVSDEEIDTLAEETVDEVEETAEELAEQEGEDLNMNKSFGTLISDPNVQPFDEVEATLGEIQEDVETLENFLEVLGDELEVQEREYDRITEAPEDENVTGRQLRAIQANKERLLYTAKLEAFKDIRDRLERKVRLLGEMVREELASQTNQNYDIETNLDQVETALSEREREMIGEDRDLGKIDQQLDDLQSAGNLSVDQDMQIIEEKSGETTQRQSELSHLAEEVLAEDETNSEGKDNGKTPKSGEK